MTRHSLRGFGLAAFAAIGLITLTAQPSYAKSTDQGGLRTQMIDRGDRLTGKDVAANAAPASGQSAVTVTETLHYLNETFFFWSHNTAYTIKRTLTASYADRVGYFVLRDNEGDWYAFSAGSPAASKLPGKPQASIGAQPNVLDGNDRGSLSSVGAGDVVSGQPQLKATYNYTHSEALDDVRYSVTGPVSTTFVPDQSAWFAYVSGNLYRIDNSGQVSQLNDKPSVNRGAQPSMISGSDSTSTYPDVVASGGFFVATWQHVPTSCRRLTPTWPGSTASNIRPRQVRAMFIA
jgi:hypothetical protein